MPAGEMASDYCIRPISVEEYHRMGNAAVFEEDDRFELLDGELIALSPLGKDHCFAVRALNELLTLRFAGRALVDVQNPLTLDRISEPQPDLMLLRRRQDRYRPRLPAAQDVLLVIEVAESSLRYDRGPKLRAYARNGIPEVWVVNLVEGCVEVFRDLCDGAYGTRRMVVRGESLAPQAFPEDLLAVDAFLP